MGGDPKGHELPMGPGKSPGRYLIAYVGISGDPKMHFPARTWLFLTQGEWLMITGGTTNLKGGSSLALSTALTFAHVI